MTNNTMNSNINIFSVVVLTCVLTACNTTSVQANNDHNNCNTNQGEINMNDLDILPPEPSKTGVERDTPIVLMTRQEFNDRLQQSPLWESLEDKQLNFSSYEDSYILTGLLENFGFNNYIRLNSNFDRNWSKNQRITQINFGTYYPKKRNQYHHQILDQERIEMIETLKLVFTDMSNEKASQIIDTLYQQYKEKLNNKDYLSDNETIHTYVKHDGKIIAFWGKVNCDFDMFDGMTID